MASPLHYQIFRNASKTFYYSGVFFPKEARDRLAVLYSFLRIVDDFVDALPPEKKKYQGFKKLYYARLNNTKLLLKPKVSERDTFILDTFLEQANELGYKQEWVAALYHCMEMDLKGRSYKTLNDTLEYIYGVAEIVGYLMSKTLGLPDEALYAAGMFGRAGQYCNMIRDIDEDNQLGRVYLPQEHLDRFGLKKLEYKHCLEHRANFIKFMDFEIDLYDKWVKEAESGYKYIPKRFLITVKTAADMHKWTMEQIRKDPFVVFQRKVKPSRWVIIWAAIKNSMFL